jgi:putative membrane protein
MTGQSDEQWQRLAPLALVFLVLTGAQKFVRENLYLFVGAGAGAAFTEWLGWRELALGLLAVMSMIIASSVIYYRRFRFRLDAESLRLRRGLFQRKELRVRFSRVQNVQLGQPIYFRPFDLVRFSLETPGGAQTEVELPGIPRGLAEQMRDRILGATGLQAEEVAAANGAMAASRAAADAGTEIDGREPGTIDARVADGSVLFAPSTARLFLHGMSSNQIWVLAGVLAYVFDLLMRNAAEHRVVDVVQAWLDERAATGWVQPMALLVATLLLLFGISGVLAVVRFYRYRLQDRDARLVARSGLLERREQTLRREKITGLMLRQSPIGRLLGCWVLVARQTRSSEGELGRGESRFTIPGLGAEDLGLGGTLIRGVAFPPGFAQIAAGFRQLFWLRCLLTATAMLAVLMYGHGGNHVSVYVTAAGLPLVLVAIHLRWRHWGWQLQGRVLWLRRGLLGQRIDVFDIGMAQRIGVTQSLYQRRHNLANLQITLPQGTLTVPFLPLEIAAWLANQALFAAETAARHRV